QIGNVLVAPLDLLAPCARDFARSLREHVRTEAQFADFGQDREAEADLLQGSPEAGLTLHQAPPSLHVRHLLGVRLVERWILGRSAKKREMTFHALVEVGQGAVEIEERSGLGGGFDGHGSSSFPAGVADGTRTSLRPGVRPDVW